MRAVAYCRIAAEDQLLGGAELDRQARACRASAQAEGLDVFRVIREVGSGLASDRVGLIELRRLLREDAVDAVVAYAPDRLSRSHEHLARLLDEIGRAGARPLFVTGAPEGMTLLWSRPAKLEAVARQIGG